MLTLQLLLLQVSVFVVTQLIELTLSVAGEATLVPASAQPGAQPGVNPNAGGMDHTHFLNEKHSHFIKPEPPLERLILQPHPQVSSSLPISTLPTD